MVDNKSMSPVNTLHLSNVMEDSDAESHDDDDSDEEEDEDPVTPAPTDNNDEEGGDDEEISSLQAWRQVHSHLVRAIAIAREAVAAKKAQRRFWMEEICANLGEDGNLTSTSVWMRPKPLKRAMVPKKALIKPKRKKQQQENDRSGDDKQLPLKRAKPSAPNKRGKTLRLKVSGDKARSAVEEAAVQAPVHMDDNSETDDDDDDEGEEDEEDDDEDDDVVEVDAQEMDDDDADHHNNSIIHNANETEDEEESDDGDDDNDDNGGDEDADQEMMGHYSPPPHLHNHPAHYPTHNYHHGQWGGHPTHPYMHATAYSPPAYPSYHPQDHYAGFYSGAGGMQSGLSSEGFYSTYSGPSAEGEEGDRPSHPAHHGIRATDSGSESDGGPTF